MTLRFTTKDERTVEPHSEPDRKGGFPGGTVKVGGHFRGFRNGDRAVPTTGSHGWGSTFL
jgi:hypothetical protein